MIRLLKRVAMSGCALATFLLIAACDTTASAGDDDLSILRFALTAPLGALRDRAALGEPRSLYGLALVYENGLHGAAPDLPSARLYRSRATQSGPGAPVTTYTPSMGGSGGRVNLINVGERGLTPAQLLRNDRCVLALASPTAGANASCGDHESRARLSRLWARAKAGR